MPTYCYKCAKCGGYAEVNKPMYDASKPEKCGECGDVMNRHYQAESPNHKAGNWPMCSDAVGVSPDQSSEAMEHAASIGVPTEFNSEGQAVFTSRKHRKKYCEAIGFYDRNGGYSDPQRK